VQTAEGELSVEIPQVREAAEPFVSRLFPRGTKLLRSEPLRAMVIGAFVRGLSMRDVESLCEQAGLGKLSKSTAQRICTELRERFEQFKRRDLYDIRLAALFLDAVFLAVRPDGPKEGVLVAWGFTEDGERVLLQVMLGMRESHEDWLGARARFDRPRARGADADRGRRRPRADQGRRAVLARLGPPALLCSPSPEPAGQAARARARARPPLLLASARRGGQRARRTERLQALVGELDKAGYTAAARCLADDLDALVVHLRYPTRHRRRWRSTNLLERSLGEVKRRTKVIGRFPGETSCLTLVWAVLDLYITHQTNGINFTQLERQHLKRTRYQGSEQTNTEEVTAA
jgi:putative transposase